MDAGVYPFLHLKFYHQVKYAKFNLQIEYLPPSTSEISDYSKSQFDLINKAFENFDWNKLFSGQDIHNQVNLFNATILNIFRNFIPKLFFRAQRKNSDFDIGILTELSDDITNAIRNSKLAFYRRIASKLNDPN